MSAARVLTGRELNRTLLARQLLLEPSSVSIPKALERIGGIQAQYAPSMYIGLWTRLRDFERESLTRALERRTVVQGTSLRSTIHLVTPEDWWRFAIATSDTRRAGWLRYHRDGPDAAQMASAARTVRARLRRGSIERKELAELVGFGAVGVSGINAWLDLIREPPSGTWERRRADRFALASEWLGDPPELGKAEATAALVKSYLRGFGPSTAQEIADWGGIGLQSVRLALGTLDLRRFEGEDGSELVDLPRLPIASGEEPAPPRFLPTWDATLLVHARRSQILPEEHRSKVFSTKTPQSMPTFTVDGRVAGSWRHEKGKISLNWFERVSAGDRKRVDAEADRLARFHAAGT